MREADRANFLKPAVLVALSVAAGISLLACNRRAVATNSQDSVPSTVKIVSEQEPGEPLIVSGTIYSPDGKQPLPGITLYVYQTDATGRYSTSGADIRAPQFHGLIRPVGRGRSEFRTIKLPWYPPRRIPATIHDYVSGRAIPSIGSMNTCSPMTHS